MCYFASVIKTIFVNAIQLTHIPLDVHIYYPTTCMMYEQADKIKSISGQLIGKTLMK